ncbi:MAG: MBL fold metallo-hydrolase [Clostridia bacterium]|nr:MBL fold metallo-hydrolase [Clostridia bacterium]
MSLKKIWHTVKPYSQTLLLLLLICLLLIRFGLAVYHWVAPASELLLIDVLDVGQSDAILLRSGKESLLIDTGTATAELDLANELRRLGIRRLNTICVTHPHEDHYGNGRGLIASFPVGSLLLPEIATEDAAYALFLSEAAKREIPTVTAVVGVTLRLGECLVTVLSAGGQDPNNASVVLRVTCGDTVLLFMGDAEAEAEEHLLAGTDAALLDCDFLKVGHHGSDTGTTAAFLAAATPGIAAISCGRDNDYGFPHTGVLERLAAAGAAVYRTDEAGTLHFASDGHTVYVREER